MKNIFTKIVLLFVAISVIIFSCTDDDIPPQGEPFSQVIGIQDDWTLVSVKQVDELTGSADNTIDVTSMLVGSSPATITFTASDYTADAGSSKIFFPMNGQWAFDDNQYPTKITLSSGGEQAVLTMNAPVRENVDQTLNFKFTRSIGNCTTLEDGKTGAVGYIYEFKR